MRRKVFRKSPLFYLAILLVPTFVWAGQTITESSYFYQVNGENENQFLGQAINYEGDVNGDGYNDLFVSAPYATGDVENSGVFYLLYGGAGTAIEPADNSITNADATFLGEYQYGPFGDNISVGDLDGDGYDDVAFGSSGFENEAGVVHIFYGSAGTPFTGDISMAAADASFTGETSGDYADNFAIDGDLNNDGFNELIIGASSRTNDLGGYGEAYLFYGSGTDFSGDISVSTADATFTTDDDGANLGALMSMKGDLDGDGFSDLLLGARNATVNESYVNAGATYVYYGSATEYSGENDVDAAVAYFTLDATVARMGDNFTILGDVNNDGFDDIGFPYSVDSTNNYRAGAMYLVYGQAADFSGELIADEQDAKFLGTELQEFFGGSAAGIGDINSDGIDDFLISAGNRNTYAGSIYIVLGASGGSAYSGSYTMEQQPFLRFDGAATSDQLNTVGPGGDVNNDGISDIIVAAEYTDSEGVSGHGTVYIGYKDENFGPQIGISGDDVTVAEDGTYSDAGISWAIDIEDGDVSGSVITTNPVNTGTPGEYTVTYSVTDTDGNTGTATRTVTVNGRPTADAGADITVNDNGETAHIDGTSSNDPEDDSLTYTWTETGDTGPDGGACQIYQSNVSDQDVVVRNNTVDYNCTFQLVVNDGLQNSVADTVTVYVTGDDDAPYANAGADKSGTEEGTVVLDGTSSYDDEGQDITHLWTETADASDGCSINNDTLEEPTISLADKTASYTCTYSLVVNDGTSNSAADTVVVSVTANDDAPTVNAGADIETTEDDAPSLDGSGSSDPENETLTYEWTETADETDGCTPSSTSAAQPTLTLTNQTESYTCTYSLTVSDGNTTTSADTVLVTVSADNDAPTAHAGEDTEIDDDTTLDGTGTTDPEGETLTYSWTILEDNNPDGGCALSNFDTAEPTLRISQIEEEFICTFRLRVLDSANNESTDTVTYTIASTEQDQDNSGSDPDEDVDSNETEETTETLTVRRITPLSRNRVRIAYSDSSQRTIACFPSGSNKPLAKLTKNTRYLICAKANGKQIRSFDALTGQRVNGKKVFSRKKTVVKMNRFKMYRGKNRSEVVVLGVKANGLQLQSFVVKHRDGILRKKNSVSLTMDELEVLAALNAKIREPNDLEIQSFSVKKARGKKRILLKYDGKTIAKYRLTQKNGNIKAVN